MGSIKDDIRQAFSRGNGTGVQLILINAFVFVAYFLVKLILSMTPETSQLVAGINQNIYLNAELPQLVLHPWSLFTFGFVNASFFSFLFNCIALYWFGSLIQDFIGNRKLVNIYLLGYIFAGISYILFYNLISMSKATISMSALAPGATAAVYAVMFATITLIPDYELFLFRRFSVKIKYLAVIFLVFSFMTPDAGLMNLGGAFLGYLYIKLLRTGVDLGSPFEAFQEWLSGLTKPKESSKNFKAKKFSHSTVGQSMAYHNSEDTDYASEQEEVDALLDKIGTSGYKSLTLEEKERLYKASQSDKL
ncbi:rhomboid family intramembrane serine protease [uncultured Arcticibacterium sp.]|uniref:rhomboid family intramembrane serine protease n=1 Tax=uncultured Arcticibacterium sp. TaxID=2173042 RepID=UPI0030F63DB1